MQNKPYKPNDNILMTNIMLLAPRDIQEIHVGGIFEFENISTLPQFWQFAERHLNEEFDVELYSYVLYGTSGITRSATDEEMRIVIDDEFPNNPIYADNLRGEDNHSNSMGYKMRALVEANNLQVVYTPKHSSAAGGIIKKESTDEDHQQKETTAMITAEDLVEQAVYAVNAPKCCSPKEQAENMLNMLGANIVDSSIYHTCDEHTSEEPLDEQSQKM